VKQYVIPRRVSARYEIIPGIGMKEFALLALSLAVGAALSWSAGLFGARGMARYLVLPLPVVVMFCLVLQPDGNRSLWQVLMAMRALQHTPIYRYRRDTL